MISTAKGVRILTVQTFLSLLRERILYNIFFVSLFFIFLGYLSALLVFGDQYRVVLHFGTAVIALSIFTVAGSAGTRVIRNEIETRTGFLTLARPLHRHSYFFGKWIGVNLFSVINLAILFGIFFIALSVTGGHMSLGLFQSVGLLWVESTLASALGLFFSMMLNRVISLMATLTFLFIAHNHAQFEYLKQQGAGSGFTLLQNLTPDLSALMLDTRVYYDLPLSASEWFLRAGYGLGWALMFVLLGNAIFYRKNL
jgi:ABC-type transport system involved in multi-copper enzyme maturation permease subunit